MMLLAFFLPTASAAWLLRLSIPPCRYAALKELLLLLILCGLSFRREVLLLLFSGRYVPVPLFFAVAASCLSITGGFLLFFAAAKLKGPCYEGLPDDPRLQPVFLRCITRHSRFFPKKHSFSYPYLFVGIPLSFRGSIGRLFSVQGGGSTGKTLASSLFSVNPRDYLQRGDESLEEKLTSYLRDNSVDIKDYAQIYLITAPRFLGYQFNPVSFWYLYDQDLALSRIILEVNNTFDERHLYLLSPAASSSSTSGTTAYTQSFPKKFHVSPFNDTSGSYHVLARDPLLQQDQGKIERMLDMSIALSTPAPDNKKKLVAVVYSIASPINIVSLSASSVVGIIRFSATYGWSGLVTFPRIVKEAAILWGKRRLEVYFRPEVVKESISRNATPLEIRLETYFRHSLKTHMSQYSKNPNTLHYTSSAGPSTPTIKETYQSTSSPPSISTTPKEITLTILNPSFYIRWAATKNMRQTLDTELFSCESRKRTVDISDVDGFLKVMDQNLSHPSPLPLSSWGMQQLLRKYTTPAPSSSPPLLEFSNTYEYRKSLLEAFLICNIAFGDAALLGVWELLVRGVIVVCFWRGLVGGVGVRG